MSAIRPAPLPARTGNATLAPGGKTLSQIYVGKKPTFVEVRPECTSAAFRAEVTRALEVLKKSNSAVGRATYVVISRGLVKVDSLDDLTAHDFLKVRRDLMREGKKLSVEDGKNLHAAHSRAMRAITRSLDGYMWDDRVYVATGRKPADLAATLVHEVNHVLNESEEHYRTPLDALREEYRAFYAEEWFRKGVQPSAKRCLAIKEDIIRSYGLKDVTPQAIPDEPPGLMKAYQKRPAP